MGKDPEKVEWQLDIPDEKIVCFVDGIIWNKMLGVKCGLSRRLQERLRDQALELCPNDPEGPKKFQEEFEKKLWETECACALWSKVLLKRPDDAIDTAVALVRHPVPKSWVIYPE